MPKGCSKTRTCCAVVRWLADPPAVDDPRLLGLRPGPRPGDRADPQRARANPQPEQGAALPEDSVAEIILGLARSQTGPSTQAARKERQELVHQALTRLSFRDFEVVDLHVFADLTFGQIAEILGEPEDTVARRYRRALLKLMKLLPDVKPASPREPKR